jgi:AP-4 complex subunit epsilon-1
VAWKRKNGRRVAFPTPFLQPSIIMSTASASLAAALSSAKDRRPHSRDFDALVRSIGECKSKAEEDAIVAAEVGSLKPRLTGGPAGGGNAGDKRAARESLIRLAYVEMLGHDASWGHVRALQACSDPDVLTKKVKRERAVRFFFEH